MLLVVVAQPLVSGDVANRAQGRAADLAGAFRDVVRHREDLIPLFVQQQMVVAKVSPGHMPVKILGFQIERERVG